MANKRRDLLAMLRSRTYHSVRSMFGNTWAFFFIMLGGRGMGKTFAVQDTFLHDWKTKGKPFTWLRINEQAQKKLLQNNGQKFIDPKLARKYDLDITVRGSQVYDHGKLMARVLALTTFYNDKGIAMFDSAYDLGYNICLDEMNAEVGQPVRGDLQYAFVNQMENLVRDTKEKLRIVMIGNTLEEASDLLCLFGFIPEQWGRYKIRKKRAVIDFIPHSPGYLERRYGSVADLLMAEAPTFSNRLDVDRTRIYKGRLVRPEYAIMFSKKDGYTVWDGNVIRPYAGEHVRKIPMRPYLDLPYTVDGRQAIMQRFHNQGFMFRDLITQKKFKHDLETLKPAG